MNAWARLVWSAVREALGLTTPKQIVEEVIEIVDTLRPGPPGTPLPAKSSQHQQAQIKSAAHAFPMPDEPPRRHDLPPEECFPPVVLPPRPKRPRAGHEIGAQIYRPTPTPPPRKRPR